MLFLSKNNTKSKDPAGCGIGPNNSAGCGICLNFLAGFGIRTPPSGAPHFDNNNQITRISDNSELDIMDQNP